MPNQIRVTDDEVAMLLGARDIEIFALHKKLTELQKRLDEPEKKPAAPSLAVVGTDIEGRN